MTTPSIPALRELLAAAPPPWKVLDNRPYDIAFRKDGYDYLLGQVDSKAAALIVAAINAIPALLDVAEAAEALADAVDAHELKCDRPRPIADALRSALSHLHGEQG